MKILAIGSFLVLTGCVSNQVAQPLPFLPQVALQPPEIGEVWLTAAFDGKLMVESDCVKVRAPKAQRSTTVLWYQGMELHRDKEGLYLRSAHTGEIARFNVPVEFGGGSASAEHIRQAYPEVARRCGPPYAYGYLADG